MKWLPYWFILMLFVMAIYTFERFQPEEIHYEIPYSQFKSLIIENKVREVEIRGVQLKGILQTDEAIAPEGKLARHFKTELPGFGDDSLLPLMEQAGVTVNIQSDAQGNILITLLFTMTPWLILFLFFFWIYKRTSSAIGGRLGGPGELKKFLETPGR